MPRFTVTHAYRAERSDATITQFGPWLAGEEVEVDQVDADWINADSEGTLAPVTASVKASGKAPPKKKSAGGDAHSTADAAGLTKGG